MVGTQNSVSINIMVCVENRDDGSASGLLVVECVHVLSSSRNVPSICAQS